MSEEEYNIHRNNQQLYLKVLKDLGLEVEISKFKKRVIKCPICFQENNEIIDIDKVSWDKDAIYQAELVSFPGKEVEIEPMKSIDDFVYTKLAIPIRFIIVKRKEVNNGKNSI